MQEQAAVFGELEREFAFLARHLEAVHRKRGYPLERAHYLLLLKLGRGPASISDLAKHLALDDSTVTRQVEAMQRRKLVRKIRDASDRRVTLVERTDAGKEQAEGMRRARLKRIETMFANWSGEERGAFAVMLSRVNETLMASLREIDANRAAQANASESDDA